MRRDDALILDMLIAARKILKFTAGMNREVFDTNELVQSAVSREIQVIGEAARLITEETKVQHKDIPWPAISGMRNKIIHEYFNIDLGILWDTIQNEIPTLILKLEPILPAEEDSE